MFRTILQEAVESVEELAREDVLHNQVSESGIEQVGPKEAPAVVEASPVQVDQVVARDTNERSEELQDANIQVGDRLQIPREDSSQCCTASIMTFPTKSGGIAIVVYDDMLWAAFLAEDLEKSLHDGKVKRVAEVDDVAFYLRARAFHSPYNGSPPDCFFFGELKCPEVTHGWRWFTRLIPAPKDGTHNQKYSPPRLDSALCAGAMVTLSGRFTKVLPAKRSEPKVISLETHFILLGFLQASLPTQKNFWAILQSRQDDQTYISSIFGKDGECHIKLIGESIESSSLEPLTCAAMVRTTQLAYVCVCS